MQIIASFLKCRSLSSLFLLLQLTDLQLQDHILHHHSLWMEGCFMVVNVGAFDSGSDGAIFAFRRAVQEGIQDLLNVRNAENLGPMPHFCGR